MELLPTMLNSRALIELFRQPAAARDVISGIQQLLAVNQPQAQRELE
jgi:hypothetical protein